MSAREVNSFLEFDLLDIFVEDGKEEPFKIFFLGDYRVVLQTWTETDGNR